MENNDIICQITEVICNRVEDVVKLCLQSHLDNETERHNDSSSAEVITVEELADVLKISKPVAYDLVNQVGFPSFRIGKTIRVYKDGLTGWIARQATVQEG